jgi:multidrug efflux pump subunit AcrA (membrane-fusion protein)
LEQQQTEVTVAGRQLALWQQQLDDNIIRAPFSGIVTTKNAQPGEMISPVSAGGGFTRTGIGTIVDMDSLEIEIDVNESFINRVEAGQRVEATLDAYAQWKIPCKVIAIIPTADRKKSTVKVRVGFDKLDPRVLPEMAKVAFRERALPRRPAGWSSCPKARSGNRTTRCGIVVQMARRNGAVTVSSTSGNEAVIGAGVHG